MNGHQADMRPAPARDVRAGDLSGLLNHPAALTTPERLVYPPPWVGHLPFAFWLIDALRPRTLVELGTHSGNSYCAFLQAIAALNLPTAAYAVDTWEGDPHAGLYSDDVFAELSAYHDPRYGAFSRLLRMTFDEALGYFSDGSVDLLHIDGMHTYEAVSHDVTAWLPKMSPRGLLLMHDINVRNRDFGVWRVWEEVSARFPSFAFMHSNGLGVAWVGTEPMPAGIAALMRAAQEPPALAAVRDHFARLGTALVDRFWAGWREQRLIEHEREIVRLNTALRDVDQRRADELAQAAAHTADVVQSYEQRIAALIADAEANTQVVIASYEQRLADLNASYEQRVYEISGLQAALAAMHASTSWRVTAPLRWAGGKTRVIKRKARTATRMGRTAAAEIVRNPAAARQAFTYLRRHGVRATWWRLVHTVAKVPSESLPHSPPTVTRYEAWQNANTLTVEAAAALRAALAARTDLPLLSVVMPVYNTPVALLDAAIASVQAQIYERWELCIADDASPDAKTAAALRAWADRDPRIKITFLAENGNISRATNAAAALASGQYLVFLDHDDLLTPDALAEVALAAADEPTADYIYSDDDKIDTEGRRFAPQFKPDWAPTLLLSYMYLSHIKAVRRSLFEELGGFRVGFEGSQDYDFALRMSERAGKVVHIPKVLYHWRVAPGSTAGSGDAKPASFAAAQRAITEALARRGVSGNVVQPDWAQKAKVGIFDIRFPDTGPRVAILIPTKNHVALLRRCIESLEKTTYRNYEIVVLDNGSDDAETLAYLAALPHRVLRIPNPPGRGFSFSYVNNEGVRQVDADYVLLLNNDTEVRDAAWLSQMVGYARMDKVGAVGARLLFGDETIQHAGIVHGYYNGLAGPAFRNAPDRDHGYLGYSVVAREYAAVTAACLLTPRQLYLDMGGLNDTDFAVAYNDVDYCYRLVDAGWRCVYAPVELFHHEGKSRGFSDNPREIASFRRRYAGRQDAWYNPNLSLDDEHFRVRPYHAPARDARPVRAVMVSHNLNHEGAPNSQFEMTLGLKQRGVIDPVVLTPEDGPLRARYEAAGIAVEVIAHHPARTHSNAAYDGAIDKLAARFKALGAEVVYGNTLLTFWAISAAERANLPALWNPRESEPWQSYFDFLAPDLRTRAYAAFTYPYRIIFVAQATRQNWAPLETHFNYTVIHNGLDLSRLEERLAGTDRAATRARLGIAPDEVAAVLVGTVCTRKGQIDAVEALRHVPADSAARLRLFIVGDRPGPYSTALHEAVKTLPPALRSRVTVVAETDDVPAYYKAADIALCTSRLESYPRVILEAMACGLPIVTTPAFGIREQVRENVNAFFYDAGDTAALGGALARLLGDDALRLRMADASRPVLESLTTYPEMLDRYGAIFREARYSRGRAHAADSGRGA